jgi:hypothetical protein
MRRSVETDVLNEARRLKATLQHLSTRNLITLKQASRLTGLSPECLRVWCLRRDIGYWFQVMWLVDLDKLQALLQRGNHYRNAASDHERDLA